MDLRGAEPPGSAATTKKSAAHKRTIDAFRAVMGQVAALLGYRLHIDQRTPIGRRAPISSTIQQPGGGLRILARLDKGRIAIGGLFRDLRDGKYQLCAL